MCYYYKLNKSYTVLTFSKYLHFHIVVAYRANIMENGEKLNRRIDKISSQRYHVQQQYK